MKRGQTIAIEGVCCAGKTTLVGSLSAELETAVVPELPSFGRNLFKPFSDRESIIHNGNLSIGLEKVRMVGALGLSELCDHVILDRSFLSALAINYGAVDIIGKTAFESISSSVLRKIRERELVVPDKILYLAVDGETVEKRNETRIPRLEAYWTDWRRVDRQNELYQALNGMEGFAYIDANREKLDVLADSRDFVLSEQRLSTESLLNTVENFVKHA